MNVRIEFNLIFLMLWSAFILVLTLREKAISGMMAAVHRSDTNVEEREDRISHLKVICLACAHACVLMC